MPVVMDEETWKRCNSNAGRIVMGLQRTPPAELWHYTTGEGLIKILESGQLWSTQVSCLNDATEFRHSIRASREAFRRRLASDLPLSPEHRSLLERIDKELEIDGAEIAGYFVACLSENRDDLSQWRAYGSGEGGYALRFHVAALVEYSRGYSASLGAFLTPVTYDEEIQRKVVDDVVSSTLTLFDDAKTRRGAANETEWLLAFLQTWSDAAAYVAPLLKNRAFAGEKEWRLIRRLQKSDIPRMKFRQRESMLSRHLPLVFPQEGDGPPRLPIAEVMVGPARNKASSRITVGDMLKTFGYPDGTPVTESKAPYQSL